jgi:ATP-binding cassette subfamily B protein
LTNLDFNGHIKFKDLTFRYSQGLNPALEEINLTINTGEIIAVVGRTGSGKSSLVQLLTKEHNPENNSLFIDDKDINSINSHHYRENIGYIPQETFLFSDTIRNNIAFGVNGVEQEEIEEAAKIAQIHETILELPKGYETMLGERGINLSGGQKQRMAIARAILKKPRILLLDDALSAVDTVTEEAILNNLKNVMNDKTCLWVSHRISSIKDADKIIVMDEGRIIECGQHDSLIEQDGLYNSLFEKQKLEESLELVD